MNVFVMEILTWFTFWPFWWKTLKRKAQTYAPVFRMEKCGVGLSVFLPVEHSPGGQGGPGVPTDSWEEERRM